MAKSSGGPSVGDPVLILLPDGSRRVVVLCEGGKTETKYGIVEHDSILKAGWGSQIRTSSGMTAWILKPSIYDLQLYFARRATQVIYPKDSSFMVTLSGIRAGSRVVEIGTGSGFLTMMLACAVWPTGKVYTFDCRRESLEIAKENLKLIECASVVELYELDARTGIPVEGVDAVFVDIADPWNVLEHAYTSLRDSGSLVVFVPTVNQVIKLLRENSNKRLFGDTRVFEIALREYQPEAEALRPYTTQVAHTGYILFMRKVQARHSY
uniref:tRNA (Adenine-N1)-methyltransferase n=1 Tax=Fervidicoccus fontis TaxID=683846 RepID=A0A7J3ZIU6_9CREN